MHVGLPQHDRAGRLETWARRPHHAGARTQHEPCPADGSYRHRQPCDVDVVLYRTRHPVQWPSGSPPTRASAAARAAASGSATRCITPLSDGVVALIRSRHAAATSREGDLFPRMTSEEPQRKRMSVPHLRSFHLVASVDSPGSPPQTPWRRQSESICRPACDYLRPATKNRVSALRVTQTCTTGYSTTSVPSIPAAR